MRLTHSAAAVAACVVAVSGCGGHARGPVCPTGPDVTIATAGDWEGLVACGATEIAGNLIIQGYSGPLPGTARVTAVGGWIYVDSSTITELRLPDLSSAEMIFIQGSTIQRVDLPSLSTVEDGVIFLDDPWLTSIELPALKSARGIDVEGLPLLTSLKLPALVSVAPLGIDVASNGRLVELQAPSLHDAGWLRLSDCPSMPAVTMPALVTSGDLWVSQMGVQLQRLDFPALVRTWQVYLADNPSLASVSFPALQRAHSFVVIGTAALADLDLPSLAEVGDGLAVHSALDSLTYAFPRLAHVGGDAIFDWLTEQPFPRTNPARLELPALLDVGGRLSAVAGTSLAINAPLLAAVGGGVRVVVLGGWSPGDIVPVDVELPALGSVGGDLEASGLGIATLRLPVTTAVGGGARFMVSSFEVPSLKTLGGDLLIQFTADGGRLELPQLEAVGGAMTVVSGMTLDAPLLASVGGELFLNGYLATLTEVNLPALKSVGGRATIMADEVLAVVSLPALAAVGGSLTVTGNPTAVLLPSLTSVASDLKVDAGTVDRGTHLVRLDLTGLAAVGGSLHLAGWNIPLTELALPALSSVGASVDVHGFDSLTSVDLTSLATVPAALSIRTPAGTDTVIPQLGAVGTDVALYGGRFGLPALTEVGGNLSVGSGVDLPSLKHVALGLWLGGGTETTATFPALTSVDGSLGIGFDTTLAHVAFPVLATIGGGLSIRNNDALLSFSLPVLEVLKGDLLIAFNPALPECGAVAFKDHLLSLGYLGTWSLHDNGAACPP